MSMGWGRVLPAQPAGRPDNRVAGSRVPGDFATPWSPFPDPTGLGPGTSPSEDPLKWHVWTHSFILKLIFLLRQGIS